MIRFRRRSHYELQVLTTVVQLPLHVTWMAARACGQVPTKDAENRDFRWCIKGTGGCSEAEVQDACLAYDRKGSNHRPRYL